MVAVEENEGSFVDFRLLSDFLWGSGRRLRHSLYCRDFFLSQSDSGHRAYVPFDSCIVAASVIMLLASGALGVGFAGQGGRTGGVEAGSDTMYCAMVARR